MRVIDKKPIFASVTEHRHENQKKDLICQSNQKTREDTLRIGKRYVSRSCSAQTIVVSFVDVKIIPW